ncbi:sensor histidine kinase, partial [Enterococcus asini]|uniref:sensor histidine kinase n=1 Tax=Enterococcus asini TaxID=57732 RepID=UPI00266CB7A5
NAIEHGFHRCVFDPTINIEIKRISEKDFTITINDNGCGIPEEMVEALLSSHKSNGFGLKNIQKRIHFYFGSPYGLTIMSQLGKGTTVQILLPISKTSIK